MSYSLSLHGTHRSATPVVRRDPFTGDRREVYEMQMTEAERAAVLAALARHGARAQGSGDFEVTMSGGVLPIWWESPDRLDFQGSRWLCDEGLALFLELARAGDLFMCGDGFSAVTAAQTLGRLDPELAVDCLIVRTMEELKTAIREGVA